MPTILVQVGLVITIRHVACNKLSSFDICFIIRARLVDRACLSEVFFGKVAKIQKFEKGPRAAGVFRLLTGLVRQKPRIHQA